jgi:hypothetical protein
MSIEVILTDNLNYQSSPYECKPDKNRLTPKKQNVVITSPAIDHQARIFPLSPLINLK